MARYPGPHKALDNITSILLRGFELTVILPVLSSEILIFMATNVYLALKPRYEILDGLRGVAAVLVVLFSIPCVGGEDNILNGVYNATCILVLMPLVVMIGAGSQIKGEKSAKVCTFLGEISYPLYITHYPLMYMQMNWAWALPPFSQMRLPGN